MNEVPVRQTLKKRLIDERGERCEYCKLTIWNDFRIPLELHHVDGDRSNNDLNNLIILCPNCHAQTATYCGRNNKSRKQKWPKPTIHPERIEVI